METLIHNLINGNLADARRQAKNYGPDVIKCALVEQASYSPRKASLMVDWLKGRDCWQEACDCP